MNRLIVNLVQILDSLKKSSDGIEVLTFGRDKEANKSSSQFESIFSLLKDSGNGDGKLKVGVLQKDKNEGPMIDEWSTFFAGKNDVYDLVDVAASLSGVLSLKDAQEIVTNNQIYKLSHF